jgi:hypothetical protein
MIFRALFQNQREISEIHVFRTEDKSITYNTYKYIIYIQHIQKSHFASANEMLKSKE